MIVWQNSTSSMSDGGAVRCAFSMCSTERKITNAQRDAGGHWLCPLHRSGRDVDVSQGWGFVSELEVDCGSVR